MVFESIISPLNAEKKPWRMFFIGFIYATLAVFISLWIFREQSSFIMVFLTTMACIPSFYSIIKLEEKKDLYIKSSIQLIKEHDKAIILFMFLFLGITAASVLWYVALPSQSVYYLFEKQMQTISAINDNISGDVVASFSTFLKILFNNLKVLAFCILFSFIYGMGAIFILTWNATVIATAIGNFIRSNMASLTALTGISKASAYFQIASLGLLRYSIHGIPEIMAYFYGALAGGIISVAIVRRHYYSEKFSHILADFSELVAISLAFLLIAAVFEVYLTPILF